ncbi:MAG: ribosomal-protein-alanine N-acetyltransferase [Salibacteraceae bacterium]|jgi:ribosomal-protein-alanine N-acetyltransferase
MIITKRTICQPLSSEDFGEVLDMYSEKDSFKYVKPLRGKSLGFYREFLCKKIKMNQNSVKFWVVRDFLSNQFIGTINLNNAPNTEYTQIGCHLKREHWNKGLATELMKVLLVEAFEKRNLLNVFGVYQESNLVSKKMLVNLGFKPFEKKYFEGICVHFDKLSKSMYHNE